MRFDSPQLHFEMRGGMASIILVYQGRVQKEDARLRVCTRPTGNGTVANQRLENGVSNSMRDPRSDTHCDKLAVA